MDFRGREVEVALPLRVREREQRKVWRERECLCAVYGPAPREGRGGGAFSGGPGDLLALSRQGFWQRSPAFHLPKPSIIDY
eukprot:scaffold15686_cov30-Tisochrysis_lutea.AAC.1